MRRTRSGRYSYRRVSNMPAWGLFDKDDTLIAACRAPEAADADLVFTAYGYHGEYVRRLGDNKEKNARPQDLGRTPSK